MATVTVMAAFSTLDAAAESYEYFAYKIPNPRAPADFTLTGPDGRPYALSSLRGKLVLLDFGFTHCPNTCPTALANLAAAYARLTLEEQKRVQVLFVTIDPMRDTPKVLENYVSFFDQRFIGLTGTPGKIAAVAKAYRVISEETNDWGRDAGNYTMSHSAGALLLAPSGQWIASYGAGQLLQSERIAEDLRHFLREPDLSIDNWQSLKRGLVRTPQLSGQELYVRECSSCHGEDGKGIPGKYAALAGSAWVTGAPNRLTAMVFGGVRRDEDSPSRHGVMPAWWTVLPPSDIAKILTYLRQAWGNDAPAISAAYARKVGYQFASRKNFWTLKELEALPPDNGPEASDL